MHPWRPQCISPDSIPNQLHQSTCALRVLLPADWLSHFPVDLPAPNSGRANGPRRFGLADVSLAGGRELSISLQSGTRILGEGALTFWLLVFGLNTERWQEQAGGAAER